MSDVKFEVPGFQASGIAAGIKEDGRKDLALLYSEVPAKAAGVFTTNVFKAAPVLLDMERIRGGAARAVIVNSGNANAATGEEGYQDAVKMARFCAGALQIDEAQVLVASTGVIGRRLPIDKVAGNVSRLVQGLSPGGIPEAAEAIMTTDRYPKIQYREGAVGGTDVCICGIAKGAGMIEPGMATLLSFVLTDADIDDAALKRALREAVDRSFNAISVDGCMSTNDTVLLLANGLAGNRRIRTSTRDYAVFADLLTGALTELAKMIVRDGEGATKLIEIVVEGAKTAGDARSVAYQIARSNLVKTAFYGGDPNWGRILSAAGAAGVALDPTAVELTFDGLPLFRQGQGISSHLKELAEVMKKEQIRVVLKLGQGSKSFRVYSSDLTLDYVKINAHYTT
ncbi:MAG TPA: bifunctional glutamate N-acetyltransferase/amino-acid acetyltransferase ArgJ [Syntrophales bacterium]|nr:bifunctional glutamate N-acetyltransferase/amino-acid acetyltransferase ArgJ [Syntrophales bacterium]HNS54151.1 bifunctional glutamate N-acetyltransferase/amino-acid acetyltransferase ArgJ [Syntrophales bacterium]